MNHAMERSLTSPAQRLWLLQRLSMASGQCDTRPFLSAITVLTDTQVCVCFVRSVNAQGVDSSCLYNPHVRVRVERDARAFDSLDEVLVWAEQAKDEWLRRGWSESVTDLNDR